MLGKFLTTDNLINLGNKNKIIKKKFKGVFPADYYPKIDFKEGGWIWNTDTSDKPGQHWVAAWKNGKNLYFFDSFGLTPEHYKNKRWKKFATDKKLNFEIFSYKRRQNINTTTCGVWCLFFLLQKCLKMNILNVINHNSTLDNDKKLLSLSKMFFPRIKKVYARKCKNEKKNTQICCSYKNIFKK